MGSDNVIASKVAAVNPQSLYATRYATCVDICRSSCVQQAGTCAVNCVPASMMTAHRSPEEPTLLTCRPSARPLFTCTSRRAVDTL